ncbi:MAG: hypothetical protein QGG36_26485 [Pirellulaceae bacterium]|jgi:hypothetical protein|nr:hypothetical protein [Pirellulaceae bacterium]MDP7019373.1 hypothetical protein [Pirellulaceae bacterium]
MLYSALTLLVIVLLPVDDLVRVGPEGRSVSVVDLVVGVLGVVWFARSLTGGNRLPSRSQSLILLLVVFQIFLAARTAMNVAVGETYALRGMAAVTSAFIYFACLSAFCVTERRLVIVSRVLMCCAVFAVVAAILGSAGLVDFSFVNQKWAYARNVSGFTLFYRRHSGIISNNSVYGVTVMTGWVLVATSLFIRDLGIVRKRVQIPLLGLLTAGVFIPQSRAIVAALAIAIASLTFAKFQSRLRVSKTFLLTTVPLSLIGGVLLMVWAAPFLQSFSSAVIEIGETSVEDRLFHIETALEDAQTNPLGLGFGTFEHLYGNTPHNILMNVLSVGGVLALILFLIIILKIVDLNFDMMSDRSMSIRGWGVALFCGFNAALVQLMFASGFTVMQFWLLGGLTCGAFHVAQRGKYLDQSRETSRQPVLQRA